MTNSIRLIVICILSLISTLCVIRLKQLDFAITINLLSYRIETSVMFVAVIVFLLAIMIYILLTFIGLFFTLPDKLRNIYQLNKLKSEVIIAEELMISAFLGDKKYITSNLKKAEKFKSQLLKDLFKLHFYKLSKNIDSYEKLLQDLRKNPKSDDMSCKMLLELYISTSQLDKAEEIAGYLASKNGPTSWLLENMIKIAKIKNDDELIVKYTAMLDRNVRLEYSESEASALSNLAKHNHDIKAAKKAFELLPNLDTTLTYANLLINQTKTGYAVNIIKEAYEREKNYEYIKFLITNLPNKLPNEKYEIALKILPDDEKNNQNLLDKIKQDSYALTIFNG